MSSQALLGEQRAKESKRFPVVLLAGAAAVAMVVVAGAGGASGPSSLLAARPEMLYGKQANWIKKSTPAGIGSMSDTH